MTPQLELVEYADADQYAALLQQPHVRDAADQHPALTNRRFHGNPRGFRKLDVDLVTPLPDVGPGAEQHHQNDGDNRRGDDNHAHAKL
jgi:hypothetical protein